MTHSLGVRCRLRSSLKLNFYFYVVIGLVGLVALVFLLVARELTLDTLPSFVIALSNAFGLIAITAALAYGLVEVTSQSFVLPQHPAGAPCAESSAMLTLVNTNC